MSGGLNELFQTGPQLFLKNHALNTQPDPSLAAAAPGKMRINLAPEGTCGALALTTVKKAVGTMPGAADAFDAYYLPFQQRAKPSVQLGSDAEYFFTPALTGCRLIITGGALPNITHVDGGFYNDEQMNGMCNVRATGTNSSATRYWDSGPAYASIVVGVLSNRAWKLYAQSYNPDSKLPLEVQEI